MSTTGWKDRHAAAKAKAEPPAHAWFVFDESDGVESCARCGKCRPRDESRLKPCKGASRIVLR